MVTDLKNLFREEAAQCRRLAEIAADPTVKEKLLEMAARFQAGAGAAMAALAAIQTQSKYRYDTSLNWVSGP